MKVSYDPRTIRCAMWDGNEEWAGLRRVALLGEMEDGRFIAGFQDPQNDDQVVFVAPCVSDLTFLSGTWDVAVELGL
jgi:hypothetical protein